MLNFELEVIRRLDRIDLMLTNHLAFHHRIERYFLFPVLVAVIVWVIVSVLKMI